MKTENLIGKPEECALQSTYLSIYLSMKFENI